MPGISTKVRALVLQRAEGRCERCGVNLDGFFYSIQHRRARGMGGSSRPETNEASNLVALCGSATTPGGCHQWAESHPEAAAVEGLRIRQGDTPAAIRVRTHLGWFYLDDEGFYLDRPAGLRVQSPVADVRGDVA